MMIGIGTGLWLAFAQLVACTEVDSASGASTLHDAAAAGSATAVRHFLAAGALVDAVDGTTGEMALHHAATHGHIDVALALLEEGAPVTATDLLGRTPLHAAAAQGHAAVVRHLCEGSSAAAIIVDHEGNTPLHVAELAAVASELIRCGGELHLHLALNKEGHSAMHVAAWEGRAEILDAIISAVNPAWLPSPATGASGPAWLAWEGEGAEQTPLMLSAYRGHVAAMQVLLRHAFCTRDGGGRLSCSALRKPSAKRALARVLATAEEVGNDGTAEALRRSGARRMSPAELAGSTEVASYARAADAYIPEAPEGSPFARLLQSNEQYRDFSTDLSKQYATIGALLGAKVPSLHAPDIVYDAVHDSAKPAGSQQIRRPSMLFRPLLMATAAADRSTLRTKSYAVVGPVYEAPVLALLQEHYRELIGSGALSFSDPQSKRYLTRNEKVSRLVHEDLTPLVSLIVGRRVMPTYSYFAGYVEGSELPLHTDRDDCEYTVSLLVERSPAGAAWPIHLENVVTAGLVPGPKRHAVSKDAVSSLDCDENAFMIFKGRHHAHFREAFRGNHSYTLLLHYVHYPHEQALMRNGDESSSRGTDMTSALERLPAGERIVRVDGGPLASNATEFAEREKNDTSLAYVRVPPREHFFYPSRFVGHRQPLLKPSLTLETLALSPRVFRVDHFLSAAECRHVMQLATPALRPSILQSRGHPQQVEGGTIDPIRTSETAWLDRFFGVNRGAQETEVTRRILRRAVALARVPADTHAEGLQVLRYWTGGSYRHHVDWLEGHHPARLATLLIFLNDEATTWDEHGRLEGGGGTNFALKQTNDRQEMEAAGCTAGLTVAPRAGSAVFFYNLHPRDSATSDYTMDWSAWHSGCNVTAGVKWVANVWIRNAPTEW